MDASSTRAMRVNVRRTASKAATKVERNVSSARKAGRSVSSARIAATTAIGRPATRATPVRTDPVLPKPENPDLSTALRAVIDELPADQIVEFIDTVTGTSADDGLDPALWGPPPATTDAIWAHLANLAARFADRRSVLARSITRADAARLLGVSDQAVSDRLAAGDLVGLKDGRVWRLPAWQFDADTENGWLPGIAQLREHFPAGPVTLTAWATTPNVDLGGRTPAARLAAGDVDQVLLVAQASGPAGCSAGPSSTP